MHEHLFGPVWNILPALMTRRLLLVLTLSLSAACHARRPATPLAEPMSAEHAAQLDSLRPTVRAAVIKHFESELRRTGPNAPRVFWFALDERGVIRRSGVGPGAFQASTMTRFVFKPGELADREVQVLWMSDH
jgi:hypothetical protein